MEIVAVIDKPSLIPSLTQPLQFLELKLIALNPVPLNGLCSHSLFVLSFICRLNSIICVRLCPPFPYLI